MFQKFGQDVPQSLIDAVSDIMSEAKADEPAAPDADAIARRKRLQAIKDKQEDDAAERGTGEKKSSVRQVAGKAYGGAKQKDDKEDMEESCSPCDAKKEELIGGQKKLDKNHNGKLDADDFKKLRKEEEQIDEVLTKKTPIKTWIKDFVHSKNSKFAGKSKAERSKMAQGAYYGKQKEEVEQVVEYKGQPADVPFDADKPHAPVAKAGKSGYGPSAAKHLAKQGLKKFLKKETLMGKAGCTSEEADLEESRGHKILATKLKQIDKMAQGTAPDSIENKETIKDKLKDAHNLGKVEIVTQKDTSIKKEEVVMEDFHPDVHKELAKHSGKIGAVMHNTKDNAIAAVVHHTDDNGLSGQHHVHYFLNDKKVHTSVHPTFGDAEQHAVSTITTKKGLKHLGKMHTLMEGEQIDELSKPMLATYIRRASDPSHPKSNVNLSSLAAHKLASGDEKDDGEKEDKKAYNRSRGIGLAAAKMAREDVQIDETAALDQYIKSMGYDPEHMDKNKKVMFSKTNAFKTWAQTKQEGLYDGGQKGTQDIETNMSPGATAKG